MAGNDQLLHWMAAILAFVSSGLVVYAFRMILALNDRQTVSEEKARNHTAELERRISDIKGEHERRFLELKGEMDRRFQDKRDDLVQEKLLFDLKIKTIADNHEQQTRFLKDELTKLEASMQALHVRFDKYMGSSNKDGRQ